MGTRAIRELPFAASLLILAVAVLHGDATGDGMVPWLAGGALAALVASAATHGLPGGFARLLPLAALTVWLALSIWWSALPDRSWDYADRTFLYLLLAALGLWLVDRRRELAYGLSALLAVAVLWSLGGKVFPLGAEPVIGVRSRLEAPVGLWNQLALLGDFALPLALWLAGRRRVLGTLLAYAWGVAIVLTLSRGGLAVAAIVVALWLAFDDDRAGSVVTVVAAGVPAGAVAAIAFALPGVTGARPSSGTRWHDGLLFGLALVVGALIAIALSRLPRPRSSRALRRALIAVAALAGAAIVAAAAVKGPAAWRDFTSGSVANQGPRASLSSNLRWTWWQQAWHGFTAHPGTGTGAASFNVTNLRYRKSYLDFATEPHDLPVQFLSETGIVGLLLFLSATAALVVPALRRRPRGHDLALALLLPAYFLHGLVDIDWDFVAVSAPALAAAGSLVGRPAERRVPAFGGALAAGAAAVAFAVLVLPWLGQRWADDALGSPPAQATKLAKRARSVDPLLVEPYWALAGAAEQRDELLAARDYYRLGAERQPQNAQAWLFWAEFELRNGCARHALAAFYRFNALDPYAQPSQGPQDYLRALRLVNTGKPLC